MYARTLQDIRKLLKLSKEEFSKQTGITIEAQNLIDKYDVYNIPEEVGLRILKALDLPEEFLDDRELYSYSIEEYLVEHGRVKGRDDDPFTARDKKYEEFTREEQESIQYYMDEYDVPIERAMYEVQYCHFKKPFSFEEIMDRYGVKVFIDDEGASVSEKTSDESISEERARGIAEGRCMAIQMLLGKGMDEAFVLNLGFSKEEVDRAGKL